MGGLLKSTLGSLGGSALETGDLRRRATSANLDKDFPNRLQKPADTPYGPYVDGFSAEQHRLGPFGPIRAKLKALASPRPN